MRTVQRISAAILAALLLLSALGAAQQPSPTDLLRMMQAWEQAATPGEQHLLLERLAGDWNFRMRMWPAGQEPMETSGTATGEMFYDGRFLRLSMEGTFMNMPFRSTGIFGYDNFGARYQMVLFDNMTTAITTAQGVADGSGTTLALHGKMNEPMTGEKDKDVRWVVRISAGDSHTMEVWDLAGTPQEFRAGEIVFTRRS